MGQNQAWVAVACVSLILGALNGAAAASGFIRTFNGQFVDEDCNDFVPAGLNT